MKACALDEDRRSRRDDEPVADDEILGKPSGNCVVAVRENREPRRPLSHWSDSEWEFRLIEQQFGYAQSR